MLQYSFFLFPSRLLLLITALINVIIKNKKYNDKRK